MWLAVLSSLSLLLCAASCKYDAAAYLSVLALCSMVVKINCKRRKLRLHFYSILPSDYIHSACYTTQENGIID